MVRRFSGRWLGITIFFVVLSCVICADYLTHGNKPANFDAIAHITSIAQYHQAMTDGDFPVGWTDGFANYGLPLGTMSHQIPIYLGAFLTFATHDPLLSFHLAYLISTMLAAVFYYIFVRNFYNEKLSILITGIYLLAPYRIINLYLRGAMPEYFSAVWVPLILHALYRIHHDKPSVWSWQYVLLTSACAALLLTHPMLTLVYAPLIVIFFFCFFPAVRSLVGTMIAALVGFGLSIYYIGPLFLEDKFLYHGITGSQYAPNQTTTWGTFFDPFWQYTCAYRNDIYGRCHLIKAGVTESLIMLVVFGIFALAAYRWWRSRAKLLTALHHLTIQKRLLIFIVVAGAVSVLFSSIVLEPLYQSVRMLGNIQYPWRFVSAYLFLPPMAIGYLLTYHFKRLRDWGLLLIFIIFCVMRFPQLYGKNYMHVPQSEYYFTPLNLHSFMMNTRWSGDTMDYPIKRQKAEIVRGHGKILDREIHNSWRTYVIQAAEPVKVSDNTFYFPGWKVKVDGVEQTIEFQDPAWRGVITFQVPAGYHHVAVYYTDTKIRQYSKWASLITFIVFAGYGIVLSVKQKLRW